MSAATLLVRGAAVGADFYQLLKGSRVFTKARDITTSGLKKDTKLVKADKQTWDLDELLKKADEMIHTPKFSVTPSTALVPSLNRNGDGLADIASQLGIIAKIFNSFLSNSTSNGVTLIATLLAIAEHLKALREMKETEMDFTLPNSILKLDETIFKMYGIKPDGTTPIGTDGSSVSPLEDKALLNKEKHIEEKRSNTTDHGKDLLDLFPPDIAPIISDINNPFNLLKDIWTLPTGYKIPNNLKEGV